MEAAQNDHAPPPTSAPRPPQVSPHHRGPSHHHRQRGSRGRPGHKDRSGVAEDRQLCGLRHLRRLVDRPRQGGHQGRDHHRRRQVAPDRDHRQRQPVRLEPRRRRWRAIWSRTGQRRHASGLGYPGYLQPGRDPGRGPRVPQPDQLQPVAGALHDQMESSSSSSGSTATCSAPKRRSPPLPRCSSSGVQTNKKVGMLFQNDADAQGWMDPSAAPEGVRREGLHAGGA